MADTNAEHYYVNPNYPSEPRDDVRSQIPSSSRDEYPADRYQVRRASPTLSEASKATMSSPPPLDRSDQMAINTVSPELLAQITEQVVEHLKQTGTLDSSPVKSKPAPIQVSSTNGTSTPSPPLSARKVYTPPSPKQEPRKATVESPPPSPVREAPPQTSPKDREKPSVRFTNSRAPVEKDTRTARPPSNRTYSTTELSTIDQKWGKLFDSDRNPTPRLGQFLRGLANHIIEEFQPQKSIVLTPAKMAAYYANHGLEREVYPILTIFKSNSHQHISKLYQDLGCQHHLVQEDSHEAPIVPGLTPAGFALWMTTWILAFPDQEASRLEKVVLAMPIDADGATVDGKPERLPKQISRHLLPSRDLSDAKKSLDDAISDCMQRLGIQKRKSSFTNTPPLYRRHSSTQGIQSRAKPVEVHQTSRPIDIPQSRPNPGIERERMPYAGTPVEPTSFDSESSSSVKIERDRQPYTAQVGNGKVYDYLGTQPPKGRDRANSTSRVTREPEPIPHERHGRTQSNVSSLPYTPAAARSSRRGTSPPLQRFSHSTPVNINFDGNAAYHPPPVSTSSNSSFSAPSAAYNPASQPPVSYISPSKMPPPPPPVEQKDRERDRDRDRTGDREKERDKERERERDRDRDRRDSNDRYDELPREPRRRESRRSTTEDVPRPPVEITSPRDAERWDRINEERLQEEPKAIDPRYDVRREGSIPEEEFYRSNTRPGYENGQQYYQRH